MFKKILAIGMSLTLIMASGAMITLAAGGVVAPPDKTVESIDSSDSYGAIAYPEETDPSVEASASVEVTNDVNVTYDGSGSTDVPYEDDSVSGIVAKADNDDRTGSMSASVSVGGNVNVTNSSSKDHGHEDTVGVLAEANGNNSQASVSVGGNVNVISTVTDTDSVPAEEILDITTFGVGIVASESTQASASVEGNVNVKGTEGQVAGVVSNAEGSGTNAEAHIKGDVTVTSDEIAMGIMTFSINGANTDITIDKNLTVTGEEAVGILAAVGSSGNLESVQKPGNVSINLGGDLTSSGYGIQLYQQSGNADIVINGTLKAEEDAIILSNVSEDNTDNLNITVWKIESGTGSIVSIADDAGEFEQGISEETRQKVEQSINYIIKIDENQKNSISLSNTRKISGLDTGRATEEVKVKLNIPEGYTLLGAYSDVDHTVKLQGNSRDGYYLVVPSGGGVYVSLSLAAIEGYYDRDDDDDDGSNKNRSNYIGDIPISALSDDDFKFDENTGILTISIPYGTTAFNLSSETLLSFIEKGMNTLYLDTTGPKYSIPVSNIKDLLIPGNILTFVFRAEKLDLLLSTTLVRDFYPDPQT